MRNSIYINVFRLQRIYIMITLHFELFYFTGIIFIGSIGKLGTE